MATQVDSRLLARSEALEKMVAEHLNEHEALKLLADGDQAAGRGTPGGRPACCRR